MRCRLAVIRSWGGRLTSWVSNKLPEVSFCWSMNHTLSVKGRKVTNVTVEFGLRGQSQFESNLTTFI